MFFVFRGILWLLCSSVLSPSCAWGKDREEICVDRWGIEGCTASWLFWALATQSYPKRFRSSMIVIYIFWIMIYIYIMIVFRELANVMYQVCSRFFASPFWRNQLKAKYHPKVLYTFGVSLPSRYTSLPCSWHKVVSQRAWTSRNHSLLAAEDFSASSSSSSFFKTQGKLSFGRRLLVDRCRQYLLYFVVVPPSVLGPC